MTQFDFTHEHLTTLASLGIVLPKLHGMMEVHDTTSFEPPVYIHAETPLRFPLKVGAFSHLNGGFIQNVTIGRYCSLARDVQIGHGEHPVDWMSVSSLQYANNYRHWADCVEKQQIAVHNNTQPFQYEKHTRIGNDVWIGNNVFIKDGITIGDGAIIGAGSIVTKDVPPYMIVGGNPAKIIRPRFAESLIEKFLAVRWWRYALPHLPPLPFDQPALALEQLAQLIETKVIKEYQPACVRLPAYFDKGNYS